MRKFLGTTFLLLLLLALLAGAALLWLRHLERAVLYHPAAAIAETPADHHLRYQTVRFRASDGTQLEGWWIPCRNARATVVYCHGNAGNRSGDARWAPFFARQRMNVLFWDYRGYGGSEGRPSEDGLRRDAQAAFDAAAESAPDLPVVLYGHSLGGAVAARLAQDRPAAGLVLDGTFASARDMAARLYPDWPVGPFLSVRYDTAACTAALPGLPKLIGHSPDDAVVPFQSARTLHAAAAQPKAFVLLSGSHAAHSWFADNGTGNPELIEFLSQFTRD